MATDAYGIVIDPDEDNGNTTPEMMGFKGNPVKTKNFMRALANDISPSTGLLPPGVRWASQSRKSWLFERPPEKVTIRWINAELGDVTAFSEEHSIEIELPWTAYLVDLDSTFYPDAIFVYALEGPITGIKNPIGVLPLSNFSSAGKMCQPHRADVGVNPTSIGEGLSLAYDICWSSRFNLDLDMSILWATFAKRPEILVYPTNTGNRTLSILNKWSKLSSNQVQTINNWVPPRNYRRDIFTEIIDEISSEALGILKHDQTHIRPYKKTLYEALKYTSSVDYSRHGDWGADALKMVLQSAVAQASLYE